MKTGKVQFGIGIVLGISLAVWFAATGVLKAQTADDGETSVRVVSMGFPVTYEATRVNTSANIAERTSFVLVTRHGASVPCIVTIRQFATNNYESSGISCGWTDEISKAMVRP